MIIVISAVYFAKRIRIRPEKEYNVILLGYYLTVIEIN